MKKVKEPAPHVKAAQIEKEAVRELSEKEVEEALTKSTYEINEAAGKIAETFKSASKKAGEVIDAVVTDEVREKLDLLDELEPLDEDDNIIKDIEAENEALRKNAEEAERCYKGVRIELMERNKEITKLKKTIEELRAINEEWANSDEQKTIKDLKDEISELNNILIKVRQENKDLTKTISKMKYAHDEEVRALEDDLAEAKILGKKANEYSHVLDDDSCAFERILNLADTLKCQAEAIRGVVSLIENETEARV